MKLNSFEFFAFFLCSSIFGLLCSVWAKTELINDREITLLIVTFAAVAIALLAQLSSSRAAINNFLNKDVDAVHEKQLTDLKDAHRRNLTRLKNDHAAEVLYLHAELDQSNAKFSRLNAEYNYISHVYQDLMRSNQEQEDRIDYLTKKLQEFGQSTPATCAPFSAPPSQIIFSVPPRRQRFDMVSGSSAVQNQLPQVFEDEEE